MSQSEKSNDVKSAPVESSPGKTPQAGITHLSEGSEASKSSLDKTAQIEATRFHNAKKYHNSLVAALEAPKVAQKR